MADAAEALERGRAAFERRAWRDAFTALTEADNLVPLDAPDLELLADSASLIGRMDVYLAVVERAHFAHVEAGDGLAAARSAGWLGMTLAIAGELGQAGGWFGRAQRLVEREGGDCVERGWLLVPVMFQAESAREYDRAFETAAAAIEIAERFGDQDLAAISLHGQGVVRVKQGAIDEGLRLMDEAMVGVTSGSVSPFVAGIVYCGVISGCEEAFDLRRAQEWTNALERWCEGQPQLVSFTGRCLAHRAGLMQFHGEWRDALEEARLARERCEQAMNRAAAGQALYQQGELHRLRGEFDAAEAAYRDASAFGREPQPGLALLRLALGDIEAAAAMTRRTAGEASDLPERAVVLPAHVQVLLAAGELDEARRAANELAEVAAAARRPMLDAIAERVQGEVALAAGDAGAALGPLRRAAGLWQELVAPYEVARTRALIGLACRELGDEESAALELGAAHETFRELDAAPDLARLATLERAPGDSHGLSARELEVLRLVAAGRTNREIAGELVVSEHTVARHLQNIFAKLGVSSRTAATAFAFQHELV